MFSRRYIEVSAANLYIKKGKICLHPLKLMKTCRRSPLIHPGRIYGQRTNLMGLYSGELHFSLQSVKVITFLSFSSIKLVLWHISRNERWKIKFKVKNKGTRISKVNDKVNSKDTVDVVLVSLLLKLNAFHFLLQCFYYWLWLVNCRLGLLLVVLTLCVFWNQFRQSFRLWRN